MVLMDFEDSCTCSARAGHVVDSGVVCVGLCAWTISTRALRALCSQNHHAFLDLLPSLVLRNRVAILSIPFSWLAPAS